MSFGRLAIALILFAIFLTTARIADNLDTLNKDFEAAVRLGTDASL